MADPREKRVRRTTQERFESPYSELDVGHRLKNRTGSNRTVVELGTLQLFVLA